MAGGGLFSGFCYTVVVKWIRTDFGSVPVKSWCDDLDSALPSYLHLKHHFTGLTLPLLAEAFFDEF